MKRIHLFRATEDPALEAAARLMEEVEVQAGSFLYHQGDDPDYFYIIYRGRIKLTRFISQDRQFAELGILEDDDYLGEEVLETSWPRQISAEAVTDVTLLRISVPNFVAMLDIIPSLDQRLQFILNSYRLMLSTSMPWKNPEEAIHFIARQHFLFLFAKVLPPTITGLIVVPALAAFYLGAPMPATLGLLVVVTLAVLGWWVWSFVDWTNDYYIITNQRIIYQERVILLYDSQLESPLDAIQSTSISSSQWGRWLGYGNVTIRTYIGNILFRNVAFPEQIMSVVQEEQLRAQLSQQRMELRDVRQLLEKRIKEGPKHPTLPMPPKPQVKPDPVRQFISTMFHLRYEVGSTIIYRTHLFILFQKIFFPSIILLGMFFLFFANVSQQFALLSVQASCGMVLILGTIVFGWWFYQYLDWHNDIYLITPDQVVDVNKRPLGQESRRAAPLKNILSIEYKRLGILGLLLNFGTVYIGVGDQKLTFDDVYNPSDVQRVLFHKLAQKTFEEKKKQAAAERQHLADWFATYNEWAKENQQPRTPPPPARGGF